ncbi:MAG: DUF882 domain-containing protein [Roseitalea porphyridii]|uniref:DUF882 domain-containing protein n=1 Tax=Roseitalea porphyridii TaxID=1852022 RepID=UPI0032ED397D
MSLTGHDRTAIFADRRASRVATMVIALMIGLCAVLAPASAQAETRTLKLYNTHTGERDQITFKRNGRYVQSGLNQLNRFLRDHRRNEPTRMDPELFDLVWEVYEASGARDYIHVVSGYRSPATNEMLRRTRGGQAKKSQHTLGKAMDFFVPGVSASRLRELGFKLQGGGVGYYPKSASPYVHLDTGNVRAWPRMSRSQLTRLFPDGKTLHLPPDGRRLPGYQQALAEYNSRQRSGQPATFGRSRGSSSGGGNGGGLLANLFGGGGGGSDDEPTSPRASGPARSAAPAARQAPRETPATVLAALPSRSMPVPSAAPRADLRQGVPVAVTTPQATASAAPQAPDTPPASTGLPGLRLPTPRAIIPGIGVGDQRPAQAEAPAPQPAPAPAPEPAPEPAPASGPAVLLAELTPPVPQRRPGVLVAAADAPAERRSADQIEASATIAAAAGDDDATALLAAAEATPETTEPTQLALAMPVPSPRPEPQQTANVPTTLAAYAPPTAPVEPMVAPANPEPALRADDAATGAPTGRGGRVAVPAPRPDRADDDVMTAALDTGVRTTAKAGRPSARDAVTVAPPRVPVVPAEQIDPTRFGDWTVSVTSVTASGRPTERPQFIKNATRAAPDAVYTAGFSKAPPPDPSRLTGNAVTFLAVARFGSTGGDGQPLQLQIPATN